jgi:hypothetical protein
MTEALAPHSEPVPGALFAGAAAFVRRLGRNGVRLAAVASGSALIGCGLVLAVLPGHLGVPLMAVGLIVVLRHSPKARRQFIRLQRRHPRFVFPLRRLIRRDPEVLPVIWQQVLRVERMALAIRRRRLAAWRRRFFRPGRR